MTMLEVEDLSVVFTTPAGPLTAVNGVSFSLEAGEAMGVVGESGSGKSVLSRSVMNILAANGTRTGTVTIDGQNIDELSKSERKHFFGVKVAMVFQDPMTSLNPVKRIGVQITEALRYHLKMSRKDADARALDLLQQVRIPSPAQRMKQYPHELSGGMRQRVVIAMALACEPQVLIADEPTTALDVTVQKTILDLLDDLRRERNMALILITHDLGVARGRTDKIAVMYGGEMLEFATADDLFSEMRHPYTEALLDSIPSVNNPSHTRLNPIPGRPPNLLDPPPGCLFAPRCRYAQESCTQTAPELTNSSGQMVLNEHLYRCHYPVGTDEGIEARNRNAVAGRTAAGLPIGSDDMAGAAEGSGG